MMMMMPVDKDDDDAVDWDGMANGQRDIDRQLAKHDARDEHSCLMVILMEIQGKRIARVDDLIFLLQLHF